MLVASIPLRDSILEPEPNGAGSSAASSFINGRTFPGFSWPSVCLAAGRRTGEHLRCLAGSSSVLTSAAEWLLLVPLFPFSAAYLHAQVSWLGLLGHLSLASICPLFPWLRDTAAKRSSSPHRQFGCVWAALGTAGVVACCRLCGNRGHEFPHIGPNAVSTRAGCAACLPTTAKGCKLHGNRLNPIGLSQSVGAFDVMTRPRAGSSKQSRRALRRNPSEKVCLRNWCVSQRVSGLALD